MIAFGYYLLGSHAHRGFLKHLPSGVQPEWLQQHSKVAFTAAGGLAFSWLLLTLLVTLKPGDQAEEVFGTSDMSRLERFLNGTQGNAFTHMMFLGDKSFYWAQNGRVLFAFARVGDKLVVLGDPLGQGNLDRKSVV